MQKLCRRIAELLKKHPILWLPYIAAHLLAICLWQLRGLAERGIFHLFTTGYSHSVLGGDIAFHHYDSATLARASIAYAPIGIATIVAVVCLFVAALLATANIVDSIEREQRPDAREIFPFLAAYLRRILLFALRFLITFGAFAAATMIPSYYLLYLAHRQDLLTYFWLIDGLILIVVGCTAWLIMPATMRLLGGEAVVQVSAQTRNQGTILAILAVEAGTALGFLVAKLEASILLTSRWEITALSVFNSIIANAPDALLFVALALLAAEFSKESESKNGSKIRELLPILMPLHFGKSEEPPQVEG
jgi:hypothetical protein